MHGAFLKQTLEAEHIATDALIMDERYFTTLAFVAINENGEREFSFARKPGADTQLDKTELDSGLLENCKIFHFGSLSLTAEPSREATVEALRIAKQAGALISYDPNYRAPLWENQQTAVEGMKSMISQVDVMKVSDEESLLLTGATDYETAADMLLAMGPQLVAVTLGSDGVLMATSEKKEVIGGFKVDAVDTTGAGDSFWGGFLSGLLALGQRPDELGWEEICDCARQGNAVAALCVQKRGGIPAIPTLQEVRELLGIE